MSGLGWFVRPGVLVGMLCAVLSGGCLTFSPEQRRADFAPLLAVEELSSGVLGYRLVHGRWPVTVADVELGLTVVRVAPDLMGEVRSLELITEDESGADYLFGFKGGGSTTLRVNLR